MDEIKYSTPLKYIMDEAKLVGDMAGETFTAERFFVAILNSEEEAYSDCAPTELRMAYMLLKIKLGDPETVKQRLLKHITSNKFTGFLDDMYMKKIIRDCYKDIVDKGNYEISIKDLAMAIIKNPTEIIKKIMDDRMAAFKASQEEEDDEFVEATDFECAEMPFDCEEEPPVDIKTRIARLVEEVNTFRTELKSTIFGQDHAINEFATGYFQVCMRSMLDKSASRPKATFLFAGPPGVGKTFMAEKVAELLELPFRRFDMSEYANKESDIEFCGSDKVYKNGKAGNVTSFVEENPKCVLLFDEIEKAHMCVIHLFLQMLDAGRLRDNYTDNEISFADAIIILTTNAGKQLYEESESGDLSTCSRKVIVKALQKDINPVTNAPYFPAAICSRFASGNVVMFNHIAAHNLRTIAKNEIRKRATNLQEEAEIEVQIDEQVYTALLFSEGGATDARTIRGRAETFFNDELYELLRLIESEKVKTSVNDLMKIEFLVDIQQADEEIRKLFGSQEKQQVLVFGSEDLVNNCSSCLPDFVFTGAQNVDKALELLKTKEIDFVLMDVHYGASDDDNDNLNIADNQSPTRDFFKLLREQRNALPVYILERNPLMDEQEQISYISQGVRGILCLSDKTDFAARLTTIAEGIYQQNAMLKLARENKLVTFETAQTISEDGTGAQIRLFDFALQVAVDSEDAKSIVSAVSRPDVHFEDVIGAGDAKTELTYFVEYLKNPKKYMGTGVKAPKGVILYGPPGTGKTLLAKAMACEAGVTFIAAEGNQFLKKLVGEGSEEVHKLFRTARKYAPSILFIDEIDAIAKERQGGSNSGSNGEETLTAFLTEMDGFSSDPTRPVFVLAATNFDVEPGSSKSLDPALMRRFDRRVYIDLPDKEERITFLKKKIDGNKALCISDAAVEHIAMRATGMSLAQLDSVVELALRSAIREGSTTVTDAIFEEAFETFNSGEVKKWEASQLERVARHEAGHAFLCWESGETPSYLTVVARGNHGGYMQHAEQEGKAIYTREELLDRIRTSLGGRAAEIVYYGKESGISTGASGDLAGATRLARQIVCAYGMDDDFGLAVLTENEAQSAEVRAAVNTILKQQLAEAIAVITENKRKVDALVEALLTKNHLNGPEIDRVIREA